jgi:hypothetical protein
MARAERMRAPLEQPVEKGLKPGALGLVSTTVIATASVAPAYSIAATLVFVVGAAGLQAPEVTGRVPARSGAAAPAAPGRTARGRPAGARSDPPLPSCLT